jgi:hypothetical protein
MNIVVFRAATRKLNFYVRNPTKNSINSERDRVEEKRNKDK